MRIGIEEPLVANHQLYATSVAGTTELADFAVAGLHRYCFTQLESADIVNVMDAMSLASGEAAARRQWGSHCADRGHSAQTRCRSAAKCNGNICWQRSWARVGHQRCAIATLATALGRLCQQ